jgi:hypothetical protein
MNILHVRQSNKKGADMLKAYLEHAMAFVSLGLFIAVTGAWCSVLSLMP